jgi:hypothetical protein
MLWPWALSCLERGFRNQIPITNRSIAASDAYPNVVKISIEAATGLGDFPCAKPSNNARSGHRKGVRTIWKTQTLWPF